jgi:hypothetical protein
MSPIVTGLITTYINTPATVKGQCRGPGPKDYIRSFTDVFRYTTILEHTPALERPVRPPGSWIISSL